MVYHHQMAGISIIDHLQSKTCEANHIQFMEYLGSSHESHWSVEGKAGALDCLGSFAHQLGGLKQGTYLL